MKILNNVPTADLYLRYYQYSSSYIVTNVMKMITDSCESHGYVFDPSTRIKFIGFARDYKDVLTMLDHMDVFLDTFPYNGTTVICEALNMGVPVVTLAGNTIAGRICASLLTTANMANFVTNSTEKYYDLVKLLCIDILKNPKSSFDRRKKIVFLAKNSMLGNPSMFIKTYEHSLRLVIHDTIEHDKKQNQQLSAIEE